MLTTEINRGSPYVWEQIWRSKDEYSNPALRQSRAKQRISRFCVEDRIRTAKLICDIGCGSGDFLAAVNEIAEDSILIGIDRSASALVAGIQSYPQLRQSLACGDARSLPLEDKCADFVSVLGLIEHIEDFESALDEIRRIASKGSTVILTTSNRNSVLQIKNAVLGILGLYKYGYQKNWQKSDLSLHLSKHFIIEKTFYDHTGPDMGAVRFVDRMISAIFPGWARYICYVMRG